MTTLRQNQQEKSENMSTEERSDTESPVGPKKSHNYVNLGQESSDCKKERSRVSHHFFGSGASNRKSRSKERLQKQQELTSRPLLDEKTIKERELELEKIHRRSRELMLSPKLMDCSAGGFSSSRESSMDRSQQSAVSQAKSVDRNYPSWKVREQAKSPPPLPPRISSPSAQNSRYKSPSPNCSSAPPLPPHQPRSAFPNFQRQHNYLHDMRRVQSPRRRDFKDFSRDLRSPLKYNNDILQPGYALSPDEDEDSGADSLNEHLEPNMNQNFGHCSVSACVHCYHGGNLSQQMLPYRDQMMDCCNGHELCYARQHQRMSMHNCNCNHQHRAFSPSSGMALQPLHFDDKMIRELETDKESLKLQVVVLSDQVDSQSEKIGDLEKLLEDKKEVLRRTEDILQREMINRSALETKKLELLSDLAQLKLRQAAIEKENMELRKKLSRSMQSTDVAPSAQHIHSTLPKRSKNKPLETHFDVVVSKPKLNHSGSAPNLANSVPAETEAKPEKSKSTKGLKKIWGKMRRSNSGSSFQEQSSNSRAISWLNTMPSTFQEPLEPFPAWSVDSVCAWMDSLGLSTYTQEVSKVCSSGQDLLSMSIHDLEIKLGIKNGLHRKKLLLAIKAKNANYFGPEKIESHLDSGWILSWLDDIGLPQYKERFLEAKMDIKVLNIITTEELCGIKITNLLHHLSIKRGIQVLRMHNFDINSMKNGQEVALWTNNNVMDWLRSANLAEYAPNLRGSGVHGALLMFEPLFTSDTLASLLSIPPHKTLLRRHLNLHFSDLLGKSVMLTKREAESGPNYQALTATAKVKAAKKSQFTLRRRNKSKSNDFDFDDMVCPFDLNAVS